MNPTKIRLAGEVFLVFASSHLCCGVEKTVEKYKEENLVFILPSTVEDFKIEAYRAGRREIFEYYSSAICATFFLTQKMGLPLPEITYETPGGRIEIINTDSRLFKTKIEKCKFLFTKQAEIFGCGTEYTDILLSSRSRCVSVMDIESFDTALFPELFLHGDAPPDVVMACDLESCECPAFSLFSRGGVSIFYLTLLKSLFAYFSGKDYGFLKKYGLEIKPTGHSFEVIAEPIFI